MDWVRVKVLSCADSVVWGSCLPCACRVQDSNAKRARRVCGCMCVCLCVCVSQVNWSPARLMSRDELRTSQSPARLAGDDCV